MTKYYLVLYYNKFGDFMKVKVFDENHEKDLESDINEFIIDKEIIDIKFNVSVAMFGEEQVYCFSSLIMYKEQS